jgi:hypothetical protein
LFVFIFGCRNSLQVADDVLNKLADSLENGVFERQLNDDELKVRFNRLLNFNDHKQQNQYRLKYLF